MWHRNDPATSREAAEAHKASGRLGAQQQAVLQLVRQNNGSTSAELGAVADLGPKARWIVARRLPELARAGEIRRGEARVCRVNGTRAVTWWWCASSSKGLTP